MQYLKHNAFSSICNLNYIEDEYHFLFTSPTYAHIRNKFIDHFRSVKITNGLISSVTDFLAFIHLEVIVSIILAFNNFRLLKILYFNKRLYIGKVFRVKT